MAAVGNPKLKRFLKRVIIKLAESDSEPDESESEGPVLPNNPVNAENINPTGNENHNQYGQILNQTGEDLSITGGMLNPDGG